jgi:hypothetical protein
MVMIRCWKGIQEARGGRGRAGGSEGSILGSSNQGGCILSLLLPAQCAHLWGERERERKTEWKAE